ncbi:SpoIIE family protein phosphatase [candidate division KSB1 bacterium]|nr:SpoIIE family protein phosphatase [candidate division KSB1 bacterium]
MQKQNFSIHRRFLEFWQACKTIDYKSWPFFIYGTGALIGFLLVVTLPNFCFSVRTLTAFFIFGFFWLQIIVQINDKLKPPVELLLLISIQLLIFILNLLSAESGIGYFFYNLCLLGLTITFSLVLLEHTNGRFGTLVLFIILGYFFIEFYQSEHKFLLILIKLFIFASFLKRLRWLENLSKTECWIYLFSALFIFRQLFNDTTIALLTMRGFVTEQTLSLASLAYYFVLAYTLAMAIKIPIVMIYNHARLARKLWISSLFQSTFPQFFQFIILLLVFQFFLAGWQADQVRMAIKDLYDNIEEERAPRGITNYTIDSTSLLHGVNFDGYHLQPNRSNLPEDGVATAEPEILQNESQPAYFLFHRETEDKNTYHFVRMDEGFMNYLGSSFVPVIGSDIFGYPYTPNRWEKYIYSLDYWQKNNPIRIFSFSFLPYEKEAPIKTQFNRSNQHGTKAIADVKFKIFGQEQFVFGRLFIDHYNANFRQAGYFAYDVVLKPNVSVFSSTVFRNILVLLIAYLILNSVLIKRVVKFGAEINEMIVQKFNQLQGGIREIASGNLNFKVKVEGQDEFVELASHFNSMGDRLNKTIAEAREKGRLEHELKIAREVQLSLLPTKLPAVPGYSIEACFKTATEVGGDFYDMLPLDKKKYLFTIGDVSGKGTSAAFYMAQCVSLLRFSPQFTQDVTEIVKRLNHYFADPAIDQQMFVTAIFGILDTTKHSIQFIRAGHTLPIIIPGNPNLPIHEIQSSGIGIGLARNNKQLDKMLQTVTYELAPGDSFFCFTDGLVEAKTEIDGSEHFFSEERLQDLLKNNRQLKLSQLVQKIVTELNSFYNKSPLTDDYTIFSISRDK